jgi:hypothetical protein
MTQEMELPPHIKLRQQASLATAPELDTWLLCFEGGLFLDYWVHLQILLTATVGKLHVPLTASA